jgi:hypothetical protein
MLCCAEVSQQTDEMGQSLHIQDVRAMSALHPIATELVRR